MKNKHPEAYFTSSEYNSPKIFGVVFFDKNNLVKSRENLKKRDKLVRKRNLKLKK